MMRLIGEHVNVINLRLFYHEVNPVKVKIKNDVKR